MTAKHANYILPLFGTFNTFGIKMDGCDPPTKQYKIEVRVGDVCIKKRNDAYKQRRHTI